MPVCEQIVCTNNSSDQLESDSEDYRPTFSKKAIDKALSIVNAIIEKGEPWTDPDFPPCDSSIMKPGDKPLETREWKRAKELFPQGFEVFVGGCDPCDINQGALGDCYFLAAISSLAEVAGRVEERFKITATNEAGIYLVTLFLNGVETPVIVDDHFPARFNGKCWVPCYSSTKENELWVMLLEKAWAKVCGSFSRIQGGMPSFAA